jgi:TolB-like protein
MPIWSSEIKDLEILLNSFKGQHPRLERELEKLIKTDDENIVLVYARRCLEVIITDLSESELKRPRGTEPLKGIIDKLNRQEKVPNNIIVSMQNLNSLSTFGAHPKDFDPRQVKPVILDLATVLEWYLQYRATKDKAEVQADTQKEMARASILAKVKTRSKTTKILAYSFAILLVVAAVLVIVKFNIFNNKLEKSIAVLPFRNDSRDSSTTIFMDGVMEEILNRLQAIKELTPISRSSVEQYRNTIKSLPEIARERHVNYIVEGSGQKYGDSVILRVQLLEIRKGRERHLMGKSFRQKLESAGTFFNIQSQVAQSIASELNATITPQEKQLVEKLPTYNLEAYEAYLKGQFYLNKFTPADLDSAMQYFELAKELDPDYALAYTGICDVWAYRQQWGLVTPSEGNNKSMEAVMRAYELDSTNAIVQYTLAHKKTWGLFDWEGGESGFKKSISLNPNNAMTYAVYSHLLNILGRPEEALEQINIALKLDPMNPFIMTFNGVDLYMARKYDESIKAFNTALSLEPGYPFALANLWQSYYLVGRTEEAYSTLKSFWNMIDPESLKSLEQGYLKDSFRGAFLSLADRLGELWTNNQNQFFAPTDVAMLYSAGKETDKSIYWLEQAYKFRDPNIPYLLMPIYDYVRNDPRFQDLCQRMNLPFKPKL